MPGTHLPMLRVIALALVVLAMPGGAAAGPCAPTARIVGEPALGAEVAAALRARGVVVTDAAACREVTARITADDARMRIGITDENGRHVDRLVDDAGAAATAIEAWVRDELTDPLLAAPVAVRVAGPPSELVSARTAALATWQPRVAITAALDAGVAGDGSVWGGVRAGACAMVGSLCVGARVRYAADSELAGDSAQYQNARRMLDLTLEVRRPIRRGRFALVPSAGVGIASVTASRIDVGNDPELEQASAIHALAGVCAGIRLGRATSVGVDVSASYAPFARTLLGDLRIPSDRPLAASPSLVVWIGAGLTYEGL